MVDSENAGDGLKSDNSEKLIGWFFIGFLVSFFVGVLVFLIALIDQVTANYIRGDFQQALVAFGFFSFLLSFAWLNKS